MILDALGLALASVLSLLPIANPLSTAALFLGLTKGESEKAKRDQARRACWYAFGILVVFFIAGRLIMSFFGISIPGLRIAGGVMVVRVALGMLSNQNPDDPSEAMLKQSKTKSDISFIPLAMPSISGPGAIATTIGLTSHVDHWLDYVSVIVGISALALICFYTLVSSSKILRWIGQSGLEAVTKIMGFLILCIGVQFIVNGVVGFLSDPAILQSILKSLESVQ